MQIDDYYVPFAQDFVRGWTDCIDWSETKIYQSDDVDDDYVGKIYYDGNTFVGYSFCKELVIEQLLTQLRFAFSS